MTEDGKWGLIFQNQVPVLRSAEDPNGADQAEAEVQGRRRSGWRLPTAMTTAGRG